MSEQAPGDGLFDNPSPELCQEATQELRRCYEVFDQMVHRALVDEPHFDGEIVSICEAVDGSPSYTNVQRLGDLIEVVFCGEGGRHRDNPQFIASCAPMDQFAPGQLEETWYTADTLKSLTLLMTGHRASPQLINMWTDQNK